MKAFHRNASWESILSWQPRFFPYDWAAPTGHLNKVKEHGLLLKKSFPEHSRAVKKIETLIKKAFLAWENKKSDHQVEKILNALYLALEPLVEACKDNENLIYFLLKNRAVIDALVKPGHLRQFLMVIHPSGLETLGEKMCDKYHQRGFISQIPELKLLMTDLIHA